MRPRMGATITIFYPDQTDGASVGFRVVDAEPTPGMAVDVIPFADLFGSGANIVPEGSGILTANLPFTIPLITPFDVRAFINLADLGNPNSFYLEFPDDLETTLANSTSDACDIGQFARGLQSFLDVIDVGIRSDVLSQLPLIGDLGSDPLFQDIRDLLNVAVSAISDTQGLVREFLFEYKRRLAGRHQREAQHPSRQERQQR